MIGQWMLLITFPVTQHYHPETSSDVTEFSPNSDKSGIWPFLANHPKLGCGQIFGRVSHLAGFSGF